MPGRCEGTSQFPQDVKREQLPRVVHAHVHTSKRAHAHTFKPFFGCYSVVEYLPSIHKPLSCFQHQKLFPEVRLMATRILDTVKLGSTGFVKWMRFLNSY